MAESKLLSIAWIMILIVGLGSIILGVIYISLGTLMPYHENFIGMTSSEIRIFNPKLMDFIGMLITLLGFFEISFGIMNMGVCLAGLRKGKKWAWITILFADAFVFIPMTYVNYIVGGLGMPFPIGFSALILWIVAMFLSAKKCLTSK